MKTFLKKILPVVFILPLILFPVEHVSGATRYSPTLSLSAEQWREDLRFLARELPRRHKNAFHSVSPQIFERRVADLDAAIPFLQGHEIMARMLGLTALIGDAQTDLRLPKNLHCFPLNLQWFGDELRVLKTSPECHGALGTRVAQVNGHSINEVMANVSELVPGETDQWIEYVSANYIPCSEILHALKMTTNISRALWTFEDDQGKQFSIEIGAVPAEQKIEWLSTVKHPPLYQQRGQKGFWFTALDHSKTIYVRMKDYPDNATFKEISKDLLQTLDQVHPQRLIIDVRSNGGGDFNLVQRHLLSQLEKQEFLKRPFSFFVITDRATQSAAVVNATDFYRMGAVLVGETTGGRPNGYSQNGRFALPNSHLEISCSTKYLRFMDDDTPGLIPHKRIELSWQTYAAGRDTSMEWIQTQPYR